MSGQPYRYATDPEKFRQQYMEELRSRGALDNLVLQAVKEYTQTGLIPPAAQLIDNRTTSEKLADIEKVKIGIVRDLENITDSQTAMAMVQGLSQSPMNTDNKLIVFMAQSGKAIIDKIKELYKYGIKGDANDIQTFIDFINNAYANKLKGMNSVKELTQATVEGKDMISTDNFYKLNEIIKEISIAIKTINLKKEPGLRIRPTIDYTELIDDIAELDGHLEEFRETLLSTPELAEISNRIARSAEIDHPSIQNLIDALQIWRTQMPKLSVMEGLLNQTKNFIRGNNLELAGEAVKKILSLIIPIATNPNHDILVDAKEYIRPPERGRHQPYIAPHRDIIPPPIAPEREEAGGAGRAPPLIRVGGSGFKKRPGRPKGSGMPLHMKIDPNFKINPMPQYTIFGNYLLNNHKLSEDIMSLRSGKGHVIKDMPSFKMTPQFKKVIKKIVGGGVPSSDDINDLTDDEIKYLNKLSKRSNVYDTLNIPTPSKSKAEQDLHDFEVMKGELMSGNDSKELIQKFKILLIRLRNSGKIPKNQYHDIMEDLLTLGI